MIDKAFSDKIEQCLLEEEKILWSGKSDEGKLFSGRDMLLVPFCFMLLLAALLIELTGIITLFDSHSSTGSGAVLSIGGIIGIILMYYLAIGRFSFKKNYKQNTIYVVTNRRVLVVSNHKAFKKIIEEYINKISNIDISINKVGNGTLKFGEICSQSSLLNRSIWIEPFTFPIQEIPVFYDIDEVEEVYELVDSIKNNTYGKE